MNGSEYYFRMTQFSTHTESFKEVFGNYKTNLFGKKKQQRHVGNVYLCNIT